MKETILFMLAGLFLFSCSSTGKTQTNAMKPETNTSLTETYWKVTELMGRPITTPQGQKEMYFILKKEDSVFNGFGGCNTFRGTYILQKGTYRIAFSKMAATLMACLNEEKEKDFMGVLEKIDNYSIKDNSLNLSKGKMASLVKFEAVKMK